MDVRRLSVPLEGAREIKTSDARRRHRRHRDQKQVRNVSSDVPATFYGDWEGLIVISRKSPKSVFFHNFIVFSHIYYTGSASKSVSHGLPHGTGTVDSHLTRAAS